MADLLLVEAENRDSYSNGIHGIEQQQFPTEIQ